MLDARDPLRYRSEDLEAYARELNPSKGSLMLLNKADLLPAPLRSGEGSPEINKFKFGLQQGRFLAIWMQLAWAAKNFYVPEIAQGGQLLTRP